MWPPPASPDTLPQGCREGRVPTLLGSGLTPPSCLLLPEELGLGSLCPQGAQCVRSHTLARGLKTRSLGLPLLPPAHSGTGLC